MRGYKVFRPDFTCREHQFSENSDHQVSGKPVLCENGFHFCLKPNDCFNYYDFKPENIVCEVESLGEIDTKEDGDKCCTNHIRIGKRLSWHEVLTLINTGQANSGRANSGDLNSGNRNSGNRNSGDLNSGNRNSGDWNSGDLNSGNRNSGDLNSGNRNSGDWNSGDSLTGVLCTQQVTVSFFDKPSKMTLSAWRDTEAYCLMREVRLTEWVSWASMSDEEKLQYPRAETSEGYLKRYEYKQAHATWWANLDNRQRELYPALPNFDKGKFLSITGIDIDSKVD
ncbi:pentapeptide repeat-containing protein [Spirosoma luteum]|uniref:pentapeptide repeat-containing protein n=1 Tax=Spirosoma luteum TaxID=431553 RepID=UPI00036843C4|nr:pentapeptide repeat-containing protein [Spirosoma luteum]